MCILNSISVRRCTGVKEDFKTMFLLPAIAAALMGACARGVYMGLQMVIKSNVACLVPSIILAVAVYGVAVLKIGAVTREQLLDIPKGKLIIKIAVRCHLLAK